MNDRLASVTPPQMRDVMIVPAAHVTNVTTRSTLTVFQQNWRFAQQWKAKDRGGRDVIEIALQPARPPASALGAFRTAFQNASRSPGERTSSSSSATVARKGRSVRRQAST